MAEIIQIQVASEGFGSYLDQILPADIATTCGAFSATLQQIRNILAVDFEKFSQVVHSIETTKGLSMVGGTDIPTNAQLATEGHMLTALGSGPYGTFTMSDFYGCMSGLPYLWNDIQSGILATQTTKLINIYHELFLAVTWEKARIGISQPYTYQIASGKAYVPPTRSANPPNPNYQPNPAVLVPPYDPNQYMYPPYDLPWYWSSQGSAEQYDWYYTLSLSLADNGGGYSRGTASNPSPAVINVRNPNTGAILGPSNVGASVSVTTVGRNDSDAASNSGGSFGRVTVSINNGTSYKWYSNQVQDNWVNTNVYPDTTPPHYPPKDSAWVIANIPIETVTFQAPPIGTLPISTSGAISTSGTNTTGDTWADPNLIPANNGLILAGEPGWSGTNDMNGPVQSYITQANDEIAVIRTTKPILSVNLNTALAASGTQLTIEQRARYIGLSPVPSPTRDMWLSLFPTSQYVFVDAIPQLAKETDPHMSAPTLEAISDLTLPGGQSVVAMMRQERNADRLINIGVDLDNNISGDLPEKVKKLLITNGTVPVGTAGIPVTGLNGSSTDPTTTFTVPSILIQQDENGNIITPIPAGYLDPNTDTFLVTVDPGGELGATQLNDVSPISEILAAAPGAEVGPSVLGPSNNGTGPAITYPGSGITYPDSGITYPGSGISTNLQTGLGTTSLYSQQPNIKFPIAVIRTGPRLPIGVGTPIDVGKAKEPGSLAGSKASNLLPINLHSTYTSGVLTPASYSVPEAIDEVIKCNCNCWVD